MLAFRALEGLKVYGKFRVEGSEKGMYKCSSNGPTRIHRA